MTTTHIIDEEIPSDLAALDESLRCTLCGDHFHAAVTIADPECGHSFCSECIRNTFCAQMKSTKRERKCPACRCLVVKESILVPNRAIQEAVVAFQTTLAERKRQVNDSPAATPSPASERPIRANRRRVDSRTHCQEEQEVAASMVSIEEPPVMRKKPKPVYANKNRKKLQEMCEKEGLPTKASDSFQDLKDRHEAFINLWNAETDSIHPRSARQLVEEIMSREHQRRKEQLFGSGQADHVALHALLEQGKSGNATFEKKLNKNFSKMIQEMRERENITKKKKTKGKEEEQARESADSTTKVIDATTDSFTNVPKNEYETKKPHANESYATFTNRTMESLDAPATTEKPIHDLVETIRKSCPMEMLNSPPAKQGLIKIDLGMEQESFNDFSSMGRPSSFSERSKRNLEHERSLRPKRQKTSMVGPWNCERCTYYNETRTWLSATCEMCNMTRPTV